MTVRTAVPPCDHYTDADKRERARAKDKTKQQTTTKKEKKKKERRRSSLRKKKHEKFNAAMRK